MQSLNSPFRIDPTLAAAVARYSAAGVASNTQRTYLSAWRSFESWCAGHGLAALPATPLVCAAYLADRASQLRATSLAVHVAAIAQRHQGAGHPSPTSSPEVVQVLRGIRRELGVAPRKKSALLSKDLRTLVSGLGRTRRDLRDKALLLLGFCSGCRRSELVGLDVEDVSFRDDGVLVSLRRSKTDQERAGRVVPVEYGVNAESCPGNALEDWLSAAAIRTGPLFRPIDRHGRIQPKRLNGRAVARILQGRASSAGLDPQNLAGHSLRSGLATAAALARVDERDIARRTGHRNLRVMRGYIQDADPFAAGLTQRLGF
jgi:integrase